MEKHVCTVHILYPALADVFESDGSWLDSSFQPHPSRPNIWAFDANEKGRHSINTLRITASSSGKWHSGFNPSCQTTQVKKHRKSQPQQQHRFSELLETVATSTVHEGNLWPPCDLTLVDRQVKDEDRVGIAMDSCEIVWRSTSEHALVNNV